MDTDVDIYEGQHSRFLEGVGGPEVSANGLHEVGVTFCRLRQVARQACQKAHQNRKSSSSSSRRRWPQHDEWRYALYAVFTDLLIQQYWYVLIQ